MTTKAKNDTPVGNSTLDEAKSATAVLERDGDQPAASSPSSGNGARAQPAIEVDDSQVVAGYANFCRVSSTPEELILDLGLNPRPMDPGNTSVKVSQRIIMNHYTAKRLLGALSMAMQRHESAFGVLETDVRRRVRTQ